VLRLGVGERGVTEILGIAEHVAGLCAGAEGVRLRPDVPSQAQGPMTELVLPLDEDAAGDATDTLADIRLWASEHLGVPYAPAFWRLLAHQPRFLAATWKKDRLVLGAGRLDESTKACVALAVAMFKQSPYWTAYLSQYVRRTASLDDAALVELTGAVMHYVSFNTIAHGMRLEPPHTDMAAASFEPHPERR
jgi:hypothetical protein